MLTTTVESHRSSFPVDIQQELVSISSNGFVFVPIFLLLSLFVIEFDHNLTLCVHGAAAADIYDVFVNEARVKAFTMSDASVSKEVGGKFTMFGGSIEGVHRELVPGKKIVQDWRFTTWQDNLYSSVRCSLSASVDLHVPV